MATDPARRPATPGELIERLRAGWAEALPTGVITFCLSDIEGSTAMWESDPAAMAEALVRHDELIADCVRARGRPLLKSMGEGDATVSVFDSAPGRSRRRSPQRGRSPAEQWPAAFTSRPDSASTPARRSAGAPTTSAPRSTVRPGCAAQADGGQIFLSSVTAELVAGHLPDGCELVDLGPHRLKGLAAPERIHAVKGPGVSAPLAGTECPYRGLLAFEPEDRDLLLRPRGGRRGSCSNASPAAAAGAGRRVGQRQVVGASRRGRWRPSEPARWRASSVRGS